MKIKLRLETEESKKRWELIKQASQEVSNWDDLRKAEAYRRIKRVDASTEKHKDMRQFGDAS